ncbi:hypothetical protein HWV62_22215 [Athelia sp. TMB]|nr:hypothetical protein HWV62_22215 [Athelia sp. TMB]
MASAKEKHVVYPASKLGEYTVIQDIAEGTFGKVKMATHTVTGHKVAMKYISKAVIQATKTKTRVQREVEYMRTLRHPHIIKLYEVISTPTDIIIVLEYAGGELFNYIVANGRMPEARARRFFQQLISGIEYSHKLKIVHRDLKPENVLLDDDLNVKIADFGLSNEIKDGDFLKTSCGSPNYAAPEVIRGGLYTGPEIDVWSAGVILYVMLCGRLPFEDDDVQTLFTKISQGSYHMPSYLPHDAKGLINAMLAVDPVKRITVPEITHHPFFTHDLPRYLTPLPPPPGPVLGTLSSLVIAPKVLDFEIIDGLGRIEEDIVDELATRMDGVDRDDVWECLRRDDGVQGNAIRDDWVEIQLPEPHHLASYASAKRSTPIEKREKKQHRTKWHFGIRSRSPPMEVMLEIYRTLKALGMEWKEKRNLGGLGGLAAQRPREDGKIERATEWDGSGYVDLKAAAGIYFVETRARVQDVVLYMVDSINYLVDFHHKKSYKASTEPGAGRFDMHIPEDLSESSSEAGDRRSIKDKEGLHIKEDEVVSPFVFMDVACRLILELAGGGES